MLLARRIVRVLTGCLEAITHVYYTVKTEDERVIVTLQIFSKKYDFRPEYQKLKRFLKKDVNRLDRYLTLDMTVDSAQEYAKETKPFYEFFTKYFNKFTGLYRLNSEYDKDIHGYLQGDGICLQYYRVNNTHELEGLLYFPSPRQDAPDRYISSEADAIIDILRKRMKKINEVEVVLTQKGLMRVICYMEYGLPKRLKEREGLKVTIVPERNLFYIDVKMTKLLILTKVLWYLYSRELILTTQIIDFTEMGGNTLIEYSLYR